MRETLPFNHVVMGVMALVTAIQIVRQWKKQGMNRKLKLIFCCFLTCIVGLIGDTITFYTTEGTGFMVLGIFGFILFIIIVGINSLAESRVLMARGEQAEQLERSRSNFIEYFDHVQRTRHAHSSDSIIVNWRRVHELLKIFAKSDTILFSQIDLKMVESFRQFIMNAPQGGTKRGTISQNTAATYFSIFKAGLKQAFIDGYLTIDISAKVKGIQERESRREYLTVEELNRLAQTPCDPLLKRAALFSALTGIRHCDIQKLKWSEVENFNGGYRLNFTQQKTKGVEYMPISEQAFNLCGEQQEGELLVFAGLPDPSWINRPVKKWVEAAGISKHITFHCFRHSYATLQLAGGTDIYTVSKMLGHTNVRTTQVYAKVVDSKKEGATKTIKLNMPNNI